jgi:hypothetical protein
VRLDLDAACVEPDQRVRDRPCEHPRHARDRHVTRGRRGCAESVTSRRAAARTAPTGLALDSSMVVRTRRPRWR